MSVKKDYSHVDLFLDGLPSQSRRRWTPAREVRLPVTHVSEDRPLLGRTSWMPLLRLHRPWVPGTVMVFLNTKR